MQIVQLYGIQANLKRREMLKTFEYFYANQIQWRATKINPKLKNPSYEECLKECRMEIKVKFLRY